MDKRGLTIRKALDYYKELYPYAMDASSDGYEWTVLRGYFESNMDTELAELLPLGMWNSFKTMIVLDNGASLGVDSKYETIVLELSRRASEKDIEELRQRVETRHICWTGHYLEGAFRD